MDIIEKFKKETLRRRYSLMTMNTYLFCIKNFLKFCDKDPKKFTKQDIKDYLEKISSEGKSGSTINVNLQALKFMMEYVLNKRKYFYNIRYSKVSRRLPTVLDKEEVVKLINSINNSKHQLMIKLIYSAGLRVSELLNLKVCDLNLINNFGYVRHGKGNKDRLFIIADSLKQEIFNYIIENKLNQESFIFSSYNGRMSPRSVQEILKKAAKKANIEKRVHPHTLRHCLSKDTMIFTKENIVPAQKINPHSLLSFNFKNMEIESIGNVSKIGHPTNKMLEIQSDGYEIKCTPEHRLFTITENGIEPIEAHELKIGNFIAGVKEIKLTGTKKHDPKFWRFIGYALGDGCTNDSRRGLLLNDKNLKFLSFYGTLSEQLFNKKPKIHKVKNTNSYLLALYSVELLKLFKQFGIDSKSNRRCIPEELFSATLNEIKEFIAGFYDAEGNEGTIKFFSSSKKLLIDVQMLLLRLGIDSHLLSRKRTVKLPQGKYFESIIYTLYILHKPDQLKFVELIKTKKRLLCINNFVGEKIPVQQLIKKIRAKHITKKNRWVGYLERIAKKYKLRTLRYEKLAPTRDVLLRLINIFKEAGEDKKILDILIKLQRCHNLKWLRIKKIIPITETETVYDFNVPKNENLITNGIISHNSYATHLIENDYSVSDVQSLLGHKSPETTQIYIHLASPKLLSVRSPLDDLQLSNECEKVSCKNQNFKEREVVEE